MRTKNPRQRVRRRRQKRGADWRKKFTDAWQKTTSEWEYKLRPRIHLSAFDKRFDTKRAEELGLLTRLDKAGKKYALAVTDVDELSAAFVTDGAAELEELSAVLGSTERLSAFERLALAYRENPSLKNYLTLRRQFPEAEIQVARFGGFEPLLALGSKLKDLGIDQRLTMGAAGDAFPPDMDELSLQLIERLIAKQERRTKRGTRHSRDLGIPDSLIDYLIFMMIEALDWNETPCGSIPASLIVLLAERLVGRNPEYYEKYCLHERRERAAQAAAQIWPSGKPSIREFSKVIKVGKSTAARWLKDAEFQRELQWWRSSTIRDALNRAP